MRNESAYTLIELLVGMTVIVIVFTVGYASFREFSRRQALTGVVKRLVADLRYTQQLALTGEKPTTGTCTTLEGYSFVPASGGYTIWANCSDGDIEDKSYVFDTDVSLSGGPVRFKILGQGTDLGSEQIFTLTHNATGGTATVTVGKDGEIE